MKAASLRSPPDARSRYSKQTMRNKVLDRWNSLDPATAAREALPCCGSQAWATALASSRPIADEDCPHRSLDKHLARSARGGLAGGLRQPSAHRPKPCTDQRNRRIAPLVGTGAAHGTLRRRGNRACARRGEPPLRAEVRTNLHRLRNRKNLCRDARDPRSTNEKRCGNRASRGRRTATSDHAASSSPLAGVRVTMGISTHILDTALGRPAAAVPVTLAFMANGAWSLINEAVTDADGRCKHLLPPTQPLQPGTLSHPLRNCRLLRAKSTARPLPLYRNRL